MSLETTYKEYILEQLMKVYLEAGTIPTSEQLEDDLVTYQETHPNLSFPKSKYEDFSVGHGDNSSAAIIKSTAETISSDVGVVTREIYKVASDSNRLYERWVHEIKRLSAKAKELDTRINSLLLLAGDTAGYFATVGDAFPDMNLVDTDETTAAVNLHESSVTLNPGTENFGSVNLISTLDMTETDVAFSVLSRRAGVTYSPPSSGNELVNIFKTENSNWIGTVTCLEQGPIIAELKARFSPEKDAEISKIVMSYIGSDVTSKTTITGQYSIDGYTWYLFPTREATKPIGDKLTWTFTPTNMRWVKFIFNKPIADDGSSSPFRYEFGINSIQFFGSAYHSSRGNTFISNSLSAIDTEDNPIGFSLVQLDVCEEVPTGTNILYYASASKDDSAWTAWHAIQSTDREGVFYPKVLNFSGADWKDNSDSTETFALDSTLTGSTAQMELTKTFDDSDVINYRFKEGIFAAVNTKIQISDNSDADRVAGSVVVWRNVRYKESYPDTETVRKVARGWGSDGQVYACYFEIIDSDGRIIDFGGRGCVLDGQAVTGVVNISSGVHRFSTVAENWFDISQAIVDLGDDVKSEETLKILDPLYPYNHKLLIEGFPYVSDFIGEKIYNGTDISAEFYAKKVSLFDLENNIQDLGYFATRNIASSDSSGPVISVISRFESSNIDYSNELFLVQWRSGEDTIELYKYIKFKAVLETDSVLLTPTFTSYRLKLGF